MQFALGSIVPKAGGAIASMYALSHFQSISSIRSEIEKEPMSHIVKSESSITHAKMCTSSGASEAYLDQMNFMLVEMKND